MNTNINTDKVQKYAILLAVGVAMLTGAIIKITTDPPEWALLSYTMLIGYMTYFFFVLYLQMRNIQNELGTNANRTV